MAKLAIVDTSRVDTLYADLGEGLGSKSERTIGNNTRLVRLPSEDAIAIRLHSTDVVVIYRDNSLVFDTGGYVTTTTMERINHVAGKLGWRAYRKNGDAYLGTFHGGKMHSVALEGAVYRAA